MSQILQAWSRIFRLTMDTVEDNSHATHNNLREGIKEMKENRNFGTPRKYKLEKTIKPPFPPNY